MYLWCLRCDWHTAFKYFRVNDRPARAPWLLLRRPAGNKKKSRFPGRISLYWPKGHLGKKIRSSTKKWKIHSNCLFDIPETRTKYCPLKFQTKKFCICELHSDQFHVIADQCRKRFILEELMKALWDQKAWVFFKDYWTSLWNLKACRNELLEVKRSLEFTCISLLNLQMRELRNNGRYMLKFTNPISAESRPNLKTIDRLMSNFKLVLQIRKTVQ